jgi:hypothetical protein
MDLVTLEQGKMQLRIEDTLHDADVQMKITQASAIVLDYLKTPDGPPDDWYAGSPPVLAVPAVVEAAVLLELSELYHNREAGTVNLIAPAVVALLDRLRDPTLA